MSHSRRTPDLNKPSQKFLISQTPYFLKKTPELMRFCPEVIDWNECDQQSKETRLMTSKEHAFLHQLTKLHHVLFKIDYHRIHPPKNE